jgi:hypothetical protein
VKRRLFHPGSGGKHRDEKKRKRDDSHAAR